MIDTKQAAANVIELLHIINGSFAAYGTALGIVRDGSILEHDRDTDIALFEDSFRWPDIAKAVRSGYELEAVYGMTHYGLELTLRKHHIKTDVMVMYRGHGKVWNALWDNGCMNGLKDEIRHEYPTGVMSPTVDQLNGIEVPTLGKKYLECVYGEEWRKPVLTWDWRTDHLCRTKK